MKLTVVIGALLVASCSASSGDDRDDFDAASADGPWEVSSVDRAAGDTGGQLVEATPADDASAGDVSQPSHDAAYDVAVEATDRDAVDLDVPLIREGAAEASPAEDARIEASPPDGSEASVSTCPTPPSESCPWGDAAAPDGGIPSFTGDVNPIIQSRCNTCHATGNDAGIWPFSTYQEVWDWQRLIAADLVHCTMPPVGAASLTPEERSTLFNWLYCGTPKD
jgi:hypothetical protein